MATAPAIPADIVTLDIPVPLRLPARTSSRKWTSFTNRREKGRAGQGRAEDRGREERSGRRAERRGETRGFNEIRAEPSRAQLSSADKRNRWRQDERLGTKKWRNDRSKGQ
eukprot:763182-Hanusia_phi.AAC.5